LLKWLACLPFAGDRVRAWDRHKRTDLLHECDGVSLASLQLLALELSFSQLRDANQEGGEVNQERTEEGG
jgi:hypothetical protein